MTNPSRMGWPFTSNKRRNQLLFVSLLTVTALAITDHARAEARRSVASPVEFNIPAQRVPDALSEFARQAQVQLFFISDGFEDVQANAVVGTYASQDALDLLLEGTGLAANVSSETGIKVKAARASSNHLATGSLFFDAEGTVSGVDTTDAQSDGPRNTTTPQTRQHRESGNYEKNGAYEEIIVTGSHIRGVGSAGAAAITFSREELATTGYSTVEDFFQSFPQNLDEISVDGAFADGASRIASGNSQSASSISLRGLGPGSTLVLLNSKRRPGNINGRAVDVSAIPLSMIERIEVVTGGRSAVYGSDAVAGVVNIVTREEFDGAETEIYYGESPAGGERLTFTQVFGREFEGSGFILGYDYRKDLALDLTDAGVVRAPSNLGLTPIPGLFDLRAPSEQHIGQFGGRIGLGERAELYADAQVSSDRNELNLAFGLGVGDSGTAIRTDSLQYSAVGGVRLNVWEHWQIDTSALYGVVDNTTAVASLFVLAPDTITSLDAPPTNKGEDEATLTSFSAIADGPLSDLWNGTISAAIGVDVRVESYKSTDISVSDGTHTPAEDRDREIWSLFGEVHFPLVDWDGQRLEVSLAGRYDDYSDFGSTFNPQAGIEWEPTRQLKLRGSYSEAFRAPDLFTLDFASQARIRTLPDPLAPGTTASVFIETGGNPNLEPEEASTYTAGVDWQPSDQMKLSLSYFNIEYEGRIDQPADSGGFTALEDEALFPGLVNRNPTATQLDSVLARSTHLINDSGVLFDPDTDDPFAIFPNIIIFDNRRNNIGLESVDGFDIEASVILEAASGDWALGLTGAYYLDFTRNFTVASPTINQLNGPGKLVDLKLRGRVGWSRSTWSVNSYVNYVDGYDDTLALSPTEIDSWTTVDLILRYAAPEIPSNGILNGFEATLGISNLFDESPPVFLSSVFGLGYDAVNADAIGRFVSLRLAKRW